MKDDKHVAAYAMYELGAILIQKPKVCINANIVINKYIFFSIALIGYS